MRLTLLTTLALTFLMPLFGDPYSTLKYGYVVREPDKTTLVPPVLDIQNNLMFVSQEVGGFCFAFAFREDFGPLPCPSNDSNAPFLDLQGHFHWAGPVPTMFQTAFISYDAGFPALADLSPGTYESTVDVYCAEPICTDYYGPSYLGTVYTYLPIYLDVIPSATPEPSPAYLLPGGAALIAILRRRQLQERLTSIIRL